MIFHHADKNEIYKTFTSSVGVAQTEPETEEINYTNVIPATSKRVSSKAKAKATPATKTKVIKKSTTKTSTKTKGSKAMLPAQHRLEDLVVLKLQLKNTRVDVINALA